MKRLLPIIICSALILLAILPSLAETNAKYDLIDRVGVLSEDDREYILDLMQQASEGGFSIVIVLQGNLVTNTQQMKSFCEEYYADGGYSEHGIMLFVGIKSRSYNIYSCHGDKFSSISERELDIIDDRTHTALTSEDFSDAARIFARCSYQSFTSGDSVHYLDNGKTQEDVIISIVFSFALAFGISIVILLVMKSKMKMIKPQRSAANYVDRQSVRLKATHDSFLYSTITKVKRESSSSGGSSRSGGGSHRGGRF